MNRQLAAVLRSSLLLIAFTALTTLSAVGAHAESRPTSIPMRGMPTIGDAGVERTIDDIMREENLHAGEAPTMRLMPEHELFDRSHAPQNPASPAVASIPPMSLAQQLQLAAKPFASPFASHAVGTNFTATNLAGTGSFPPDNDGAVGPTQYVCAVNGRIISFNKTTGLADGVLNANIDTFFSSVRNASSTSDPMCRYDRLSGRWFVSIINVSTPNRWLLAVSDAASNGVLTAGTVWTFYFFVPATVAPAISNGSTCLTDYPSLGVDANALYMGGDEFCGTGQPFQQTDVFVIRKSSVLSGGPIVVTAFRGLMTATGGYVGPFAPRGVDNEDPSTNEGYFVGADGATYGTLYMNRVANPGGTPTLSANIPITIPTTAEPRPVPHPGNTGGYWGRLDALDTRLFHAVMRGQQLWTSHNVGVNNAGVSSGVYTSDTRVGSRWYQINVPVSSGAPSITQSGTVFTASASNDSLQKNYFIPSISVSGQGHAVMSVCSAGQNDFINAAAVGRLASDPLGTMQSPVAVTTQTSFTYNPAGNPGGISAGQPRRWGDYSTTTLDPVDDMSMWTVEQFADANNSYGVRVARILAPPPATPSALANVTAGQSAVILTLTGVSSNGSGFYDPGANLAAPAKPFNHLSANCTAGAATGTPPTITSVTYVNPTTLTVVFNATSATANLAGQNYTISVTNPDGQVASSAIVHVVSGVADTQAPVATLTSPAGGESWNVGSVHNITWTATDDVGVSAIDLALSTDGGATFPTAIATGIANSGTSAWTVPQVLSSTARVRVTAHDAAGNIAADSSHTNFTTTGWTIVASAGANGSISPNGSTIVGDGATPTYTITGAPGFGVTDVLVNNISVGAVTSYPFAAVHANQTISATFAVRTYTVTLATSGSGTAAASPNQPNYNYGANVSLTATPAGGAVFTGWTGDTTTTTNPLALVITRDRSLSANFAWPITASAGSGGSISPNGVTNVVTGGSQAYTITANSGFQISSVTVDGSSVGAVSTFTFTNVTASHTIAAAFSAVSTGSAYPMISGNYLEQFGDIANWTNNFAAGIGATYWHSVAVNATGTIPDGVKTTTSTATFSTGTTGGVQKGTGTINLLSTGTTDNSTADALDVLAVLSMLMKKRSLAMPSPLFS